MYAAVYGDCSFQYVVMDSKCVNFVWNYLFLSIECCSQIGPNLSQLACGSNSSGKQILSLSHILKWHDFTECGFSFHFTYFYWGKDRERAMWKEKMEGDHYFKNSTADVVCFSVCEPGLSSFYRTGLPSTTENDKFLNIFSKIIHKI